MKKIVLATANWGKLREIEALLSGLDVSLASVSEYKNLPTIVEDGDSFFANAFKKARLVCDATGEAALADDSGLVVDFLGGAPGVFSARYAGEGATDDENNRKLLAAMKGVPKGKRGCAFRCVLVLCFLNGEHITCEGTWRGEVAEAPAGSGGFGYDPIVYLPERGLTVAQLDPAEKNRLSHRAQALAKLREELLRMKSGRSAAW